MKRSCPSLKSIRWRKALRQTAGAISGSRPSSTSTNAHAAQNASGIPSLLRPGCWRLLARAGMRRGLGGGGLLQILEEFGARIEHHQVALVPERRLVGLETAVEGVELRILAVGSGVDRRRLRVAVALGLLRLAVGGGQDHFALPIGVGANLLRLGHTL